MAKIRVRVYGPGKAPQRPKTTAPVRNKLVTLFTEMLAREPGDTRMFIEGKEFEKVYIDFRRVGPGAAIGLWLRQEPNGARLQDKAISILMGGKDAAADRKVFGALRRLGRRLAYPDSMYAEIEKDPRPMIAMVFFDRAAYEEPILTVAAECLSMAYYK